MKTSSIFVLCLALTVTAAQAQVANTPGATLPAPTPYQIVDIGPNHQVWQWETFEALPNGQMAPHIHTYTELSSGLNYLDPVTGQYLPAESSIEAFAGGAVAMHCQNQIIFANNLNSPGAVDVKASDGNRLRSNILGLVYVDPATGQAVQIGGGLQDSEGELIANNAVLYPNAFAGVDVDVLYKNRLDGLEQELIIRTQLPSPASLGMSSENVELEAFTEFLSPPAASVADLETDTQGMESDQAVSWGATHLGRGKAFILGGEDAPANVVKRYVAIGGRYFLLEKVRFADIQQAMSQLPEQASNALYLKTATGAIITLDKGTAKKGFQHIIQGHLAAFWDGNLNKQAVSLWQDVSPTRMLELLSEAAGKYKLGGPIGQPIVLSDGTSVILAVANNEVISFYPLAGQLGVVDGKALAAAAK